MRINAGHVTHLVAQSQWLSRVELGTAKMRLLDHAVAADKDVVRLVITFDILLKSCTAYHAEHDN